MQRSSVDTGECATIRRGRPRAFDRDAALTTAMHLFWAKGYSATSIGDLTAAIGIGAPSLYAAFGSKEALYSEALAQYTKVNETTAWGASTALIPHAPPLPLSWTIRRGGAVRLAWQRSITAATSLR
jgi:AcrR family transcriptional regulator